MRRPGCFVFDKKFEFAKFIDRQNQSVQKRLCQYVCLPYPYPLRASGLTVWFNASISA